LCAAAISCSRSPAEWQNPRNKQRQIWKPRPRRLITPKMCLLFEQKLSFQLKEKEEVHNVLGSVCLLGRKVIKIPDIIIPGKLAFLFRQKKELDMFC
jgi:hypothetical protein